MFFHFAFHAVFTSAHHSVVHHHWHHSFEFLSLLRCQLAFHLFTGLNMHYQHVSAHRLYLPYLSFRRLHIHRGHAEHFSQFHPCNLHISPLFNHLLHHPEMHCPNLGSLFLIESERFESLKHGMHIPHPHASAHTFVLHHGVR